MANGIINLTSTNSNKLAGKIEEANQIITYYPGKIAYIDQVVRERFCAPE